MLTEHRLAENKALIRSLNQRVAVISETLDTFGSLKFMCECGIYACRKRIELTANAFEAIRSEPTHFLVHPDHVLYALEIVVLNTPGATSSWRNEPVRRPDPPSPPNRETPQRNHTHRPPTCSSSTRQAVLAQCGYRLLGAPRSRIQYELSSRGWTRTNNPPVNSRMLCQLSYAGRQR